MLWDIWGYRFHSPVAVSHRQVGQAFLKMEIQLQLALVNMGFVAHKPGMDRKRLRDSNTFEPPEHIPFSPTLISAFSMLASFYFSSNVLFHNVCVCVFYLEGGGHRWLLAKLGSSSSLMTWKKNEGLLVLFSYLTILGK